MTKVTKENCIANNDYMSAIEKFNSTNTRWKEYWWDCLEQIYQNCEEFANKYILYPAQKIVAEVTKKIRKSKYDELIDTNGFNIRANDSEFCYLFRFFNDAGELLCSKVGTTTRTVRKRLIEELNSKTYKNMGATNAIIDRIYDCRDIPAEGLESLIRSEYIKKYPKSFKKNDRFINELFDLDYCDKVAKKYLA